VIGCDDVAVALRGTHPCMRCIRMEAARTSSLQAGRRFGCDPVLSQQFLALAITTSVPNESGYPCGHHGRPPERASL
jgi:hypothetical protein